MCVLHVCTHIPRNKRAPACTRKATSPRKRSGGRVSTTRTDAALFSVRASQSATAIGLCNSVWRGVAYGGYKLSSHLCQLHRLGTSLVSTSKSTFTIPGRRFVLMHEQLPSTSRSVSPLLLLPPLLLLLLEANWAIQNQGHTMVS